MTRVTTSRRVDDASPHATQSAALPRVGRVAVAAVCLASLSACAPPAQPRTSAPIPFQEFQEIGAVVDASRAFPVAFFADPAAKPRIVEVDGQELYAADWVTHIAKNINQALAKVSLYDARFMPVAQKIFHDELRAGRYTYPFKGAAEELRQSRMRARVAALRFVSARRVALGAESGVKVAVELRIGPMTRLYAHEATGSRWDVECFTAIARKILADPRFWEAVKSGL